MFQEAAEAHQGTLRRLLPRSRGHKPHSFAALRVLCPDRGCLLYPAKPIPRRVEAHL
ncbi:hypothetical protein C8Q77DRAFT_1092964 [Trametes polyzona]|nr:hypothetical protein C8Q77DRAFT_1092964 [Trametes polyzona]